MRTPRAYFAKDGTYGNAAGLVIVSTAGFTEADWEEIDQASDDERAAVAERIADRVNDRRGWYVTRYGGQA